MKQTERSHRVALVTGGSRGIGRAICLELAKMGLVVAIGYHKREDGALETSRMIVNDFPKNPGVTVVPIDLANSNSCQEAVEGVAEEFGGVDILVNNAAISEDAPALGMEDETWRKVLSTNLDGAFFMSRACGKYMLRRRWGRIINISSIVAQKGGRGQSNYVASKAGIEGLTRALAIELAPRGILVNAVAPGPVLTEMSEGVLNEHKDRVLPRMLLDRFGKPQEIASVVAFLASDSASFITGQVISVDGGYGMKM
ncbi:MAG: 3-oxoacyl-ACP reductase FabG [Candidatus Riflebacteria bacterium]|nr:3-oxoacyl-ACP reductase FabG [Candidatus Riflebacteria bacterium]